MSNNNLLEEATFSFSGSTFKLGPFKGKFSVGVGIDGDFKSLSFKASGKILEGSISATEIENGDWKVSGNVSGTHGGVFEIKVGVSYEESSDEPKLVAGVYLKTPDIGNSPAELAEKVGIGKASAGKWWCFAAVGGWRHTHPGWNGHGSTDQIDHYAGRQVV